jgi:hypothetical protein
MERNMGVIGCPSFINGLLAAEPGSHVPAHLR